MNKRDVLLTQVSSLSGGEYRDWEGNWKPLQALYDQGWTARGVFPAAYGTQDRYSPPMILFEREEDWDQEPIDYIRSGFKITLDPLSTDNGEPG